MKKSEIQAQIAENILRGSYDKDSFGYFHVRCPNCNQIQKDTPCVVYANGMTTRRLAGVLYCCNIMVNGWFSYRSLFYISGVVWEWAELADYVAS